MPEPASTEQLLQTQEIQHKLAKLPLVSAEISKLIVGQKQIVDELLISVLANRPGEEWGLPSTPHAGTGTRLRRGDL